MVNEPEMFHVEQVAKRVAPLSLSDAAIFGERSLGDMTATRHHPPPTTHPIDPLQRFEALINDDAAQTAIAARLERRESEDRSRAADRFKRRQDARWREIPSAYRETFDPTLCRLPMDVIDHVRRWSPADARGIGLVGESGYGKTRLLVTVLRRVSCSWVYIPATGYATSIRDQWNDDYRVAHRAEDVIEGSRRARILLLDDVGNENPTESVSEALFDLIEFRTSRGMPILWTCNLDAETLKQRHRTRGAALVRRLREFTWTP